MDFFKRLLVFIFFALTIFSSNCSFAVENISSCEKSIIISAPKAIEHVFLNSKENEFNISACSGSETFLNSRRDEENTSASFDKAVFSSLFLNNDLLVHKNIDINLNGNSELALLFLLFELQPNAP